MFQRIFSQQQLLPGKTSSNNALKIVAALASVAAVGYIGWHRLVIGKDYQVFGQSIVRDYSALRTQAFQTGLECMQNHAQVLDKLISHLFKAHSGTHAHVTLIQHEEKYQEATRIAVTYHLLPTLCTIDIQQQEQGKKQMATQTCSSPALARHSQVHFYFPLAVQVKSDSNDATSTETQFLALHLVLEHVSSNLYRALDDTQPMRITQVSVCDANKNLGKFTESTYFANKFAGRAAIANFGLVSPLGKDIVLEKAIAPNGTLVAAPGYLQKTIEQKI